MADADTENKRRSALSMPPFVVAPLADGTIGDADRMQATWLYSGIAAGAAVSDYRVQVGLLGGVYRMKLIT